MREHGRVPRGTQRCSSRRLGARRSPGLDEACLPSQGWPQALDAPAAASQLALALALSGRREPYRLWLASWRAGPDARRCETNAARCTCTCTLILTASDASVA